MKKEKYNYHNFSKYYLKYENFHNLRRRKIDYKIINYKIFYIF